MPRMWMAGLLVAVLAGCGEEIPTGPSSADLERERAELAKQQDEARQRKAAPPRKTPAEAAAEMESAFAALAEDYTYDATDKRDPFEPFRIQAPTAESNVGGPLEQFELEQLEIVAVVWDAQRARAMVTDPGGATYTVSVGSRVGKNAGRVIHIGDNMVLVKETYVDFGGEQTTKDVELRVRQGG